MNKAMTIAALIIVITVVSIVSQEIGLTKTWISLPSAPDPASLASSGWFWSFLDTLGKIAQIGLNLISSLVQLMAFAYPAPLIVKTIISSALDAYIIYVGVQLIRGGG